MFPAIILELIYHQVSVFSDGLQHCAPLLLLLPQLLLTSGLLFGHGLRDPLILVHSLLLLSVCQLPHEPVSLPLGLSVE